MLAEKSVFDPRKSGKGRRVSGRVLEDWRSVLRVTLRPGGVETGLTPESVGEEDERDDLVGHVVVDHPVRERARRVSEIDKEESSMARAELRHPPLVPDARAVVPAAVRRQRGKKIVYVHGRQVSTCGRVVDPDEQDGHARSRLQHTKAGQQGFRALACRHQHSSSHLIGLTISHHSAPFPCLHRLSLALSPSWSDSDERRDLLSRSDFRKLADLAGDESLDCDAEFAPEEGA